VEFKIFKINQDKVTLFCKIKFDGDFPIFKPKNEELIENKVWKLFETKHNDNLLF